LQVRKRDAEDALLLLKAEYPREFEVPGFGIYQLPVCPKCGSFDVSYDGLNRPLSYVTFAVGFPVPINVKGWQCRSCGNRWKEEPKSNPV